MRLLHTSDWHLGRTLYGKKRYQEFSLFLDWLLAALRDHAVHVLVIAGDIFDTTTPSNTAQELYYRFLAQISTTPCRHVVIVAGNHDSPSFLSAPKALLKALDVHVVGTGGENPDEEILLLRDGDNRPEMIVCAVPYLRDREIRQVDAGESVEDKDRKLVAGIQNHYATLTARAEQIRAQYPDQSLPLIATGHLFTAGGQTQDGDGVRELYVGALAHVGAAIFPPAIDYLALGHLHVPQKVGGSETRRYSGSPLAMSFGEASQQKSVCLVDFAANAPATPPTVTLLPVPVFQALHRLSGDRDSLVAALTALCAKTTQSTWVEIVYTGTEVIGDLRDTFEAVIAESPLEILRIKTTRLAAHTLVAQAPQETLEDLSPTEVFERCMDAANTPPEQRDALRRVYQEALSSLHDQDLRAE